MLEFVSDTKEESEILRLIRSSLPKWSPDRDGRVRLAQEINKLYSFLGEAKTAELHRLARQCHVEINEKMTREEADRLWLHLTRYLDTYDDEGIPA